MTCYLSVVLQVLPDCIYPCKNILFFGGEGSIIYVNLFGMDCSRPGALFSSCACNQRVFLILMIRLSQGGINFVVAGTWR